MNVLNNFSCPLCCCQQMGTIEALREHLLYFTYRPFTCPVCSKQITGIQKMVCHLECHIDQPEFRNDFTLMSARNVDHKALHANKQSLNSSNSVDEQNSLQDSFFDSKNIKVVEVDLPFIQNGRNMTSVNNEDLKYVREPFNTFNDSSSLEPKSTRSVIDNTTEDLGNEISTNQNSKRKNLSEEEKNESNSLGVLQRRTTEIELTKKTFFKEINLKDSSVIRVNFSEFDMNTSAQRRNSIAGYSNSYDKQTGSSLYETSSTHFNDSEVITTVSAYVCSHCNLKVVGQNLYLAHLQDHLAGNQSSILSSHDKKKQEADSNYVCNASVDDAKRCILNDVNENSRTRFEKKMKMPLALSENRTERNAYQFSKEGTPISCKRTTIDHIGNAFPYEENSQKILEKATNTDHNECERTSAPQNGRCRPTIDFPEQNGAAHAASLSHEEIARTYPDTDLMNQSWPYLFTGSRLIREVLQEKSLDDKNARSLLIENSQNEIDSAKVITSSWCQDPTDVIHSNSDVVKNKSLYFHLDKEKKSCTVADRSRSKIAVSNLTSKPDATINEKCTNGEENFSSAITELKSNNVEVTKGTEHHDSELEAIACEQLVLSDKCSDLSQISSSSLQENSHSENKYPTNINKSSMENDYVGSEKIDEYKKNFSNTETYLHKKFHHERQSTTGQALENNSKFFIPNLQSIWVNRLNDSMNSGIKDLHFKKDIPEVPENPSDVTETFSSLHKSNLLTDGIILKSVTAAKKSDLMGLCCDNKNTTYHDLSKSFIPEKSVISGSKLINEMEKEFPVVECILLSDVECCGKSDNVISISACNSKGMVIDCKSLDYVDDALHNSLSLTFPLSDDKEGIGAASVNNETDLDSISKRSIGEKSEAVNSNVTDECDRLHCSRTDYREEQKYTKHNCKTCGIDFLNRSNFRRHMREKHDAQRRENACRECYKKFRSRRQLINHLDVHRPDKSFSCSLCGHRCFTKAGIRTHKFEVHNPKYSGDRQQRAFKCQHCLEVFTKKFSLIRHIKRKHEELKYSCGLCSRMYSCEENLQNHNLSAHTAAGNAIKSRCPVCNNPFKSRFAMKRHLSVRHPYFSLESNMKENFIDKKEDMNIGVAESINSLEVTKFTSSKSNINQMAAITFQQSSNFGDHSSKNFINISKMDTVQLNDEKEFELSAATDIEQIANNCNSSFRSEDPKLFINSTSTLNSAATMTKNSNNDKSVFPVFRKYANLLTRRFKCSQCSAEFARKDYLTQHLKSHSSDRPFECEVCGMKFAKRGVFNTHRDKHAAVPRHQCSVCRKRFKFKVSMKYHSCVSTDC